MSVDAWQSDNSRGRQQRNTSRMRKKNTFVVDWRDYTKKMAQLAEKSVSRTATTMADEGALCKVCWKKAEEGTVCCATCDTETCRQCCFVCSCYHVRCMLCAYGTKPCQYCEALCYQKCACCSKLWSAQGQCPSCNNCVCERCWDNKYQCCMTCIRRFYSRHPRPRRQHFRRPSRERRRRTVKHVTDSDSIVWDP